MKRILSSWGIFISCMLLLGLGATRYGKAADLTLVSVRLSLIAVLSALAVRETWKYFQREDRAHPSMNNSLLQRCRRWYHGEA